jgi:hypothetical protein
MDDAANKPVHQKMVSQLQKRDKEKHVATVGANHPALAVLHSRHLWPGDQIQLHRPSAHLFDTTTKQQ